MYNVMCVCTSTHTLHSQVPDIIVCEAPVGCVDHCDVPSCVEWPVHLVLPILLTFDLQQFIYCY